MISSTQNPLVKHFVKLRQSRGYRQTKKRVILSSCKTIRELAQFTTIKTILECQDLSIPSEKRYLTTLPIIKKITGLQAPEGVVAEVELPEYQDLSKCSRLLILDRIQDPGNLGTLLRTALAFGFEGVYLLDGCVDPYNDKALRAAKGATFRLPLGSGSLEELRYTGKLFAADPKGDLIEDSDFQEPFALVLGNEGQGLSEDVKASAKRLAIGMEDSVESLNVATAGAIMMYMSRVKS